MIEIDGTRWGTAKEIGDALGYSRAHIINLAKKHDIPKLPVSTGHVLYDFTKLARLEAEINKHRVW